MLYHLVAMADNRVIGKDNRLPWHFSSDLKNFKELTLGHTVIMGRKTFESIGRRPLAGRQNFVLSRTKKEDSESDRKQDNLKFFDSLETALKNISTSKAFVIGGATLYEQTIHKVDGIYLTHIHQNYEGDTFYPEIPPSFREKSRRKLQENPTLEVIFYEKQKSRIQSIVRPRNLEDLN